MKKRIITILLLVSLILTFFITTVYAAPPSTTKFTTGLASDMGYFLQVYDGGWTDIKTPKHWGTGSATTALCLDHTKTGPSSTQNYVRFSAISLYSQRTINGLYAIIENGYPYGDYIYQMSGNEIKTATANAIRIWMRESEGIGYSYMTTSNIRAKSGYDHVYNAMVDLVNKARSAGSSPLSWSGQYVMTSPSVVELAPNAGGTALTATFTVNNPASDLAINTSKLPSGVTITGTGSTRTITAPLGTSDATISNVFEGQSNRSIYNIYFYKPSYGTAYQPLIVWDYDTDRTVIYGDLTIKGQDGGYVRVIKNGESTAEKLQGGIFGVYNMSNTKVATLTTNSSGQTTSGMIPSGNYYVMETKAPTGYVLDSTKHNITVGTTMQTHTVTLSNT